MLKGDSEKTEKCILALRGRLARNSARQLQNFCSQDVGQSFSD
eukprot:COSAG05_NODE_15146_length_377_cov_0.830935_1_plen_42_part_10